VASDEEIVAAAAAAADEVDTLAVVFLVDGSGSVGEGEVLDGSLSGRLVQCTCRVEGRGTQGHWPLVTHAFYR
jgi:hypothetical protein